MPPRKLKKSKTPTGPDVNNAGSNIPNVPWDTVPEKDDFDEHSAVYGPYFTKVGSNSPEIRAKVTDFDHNTMLRIVQSGKWPQIDTIQDYARHAIHLVNEVFARHLNDPKLNTALAAQRIMQFEADQEYENSIYQETLAKNERLVNNLRAHGDHDRAQEVLNDVWKKIETMEPYWKHVWQDTFKQKWPDFKPSK